MDVCWEYYTSYQLYLLEKVAHEAMEILNFILLVENIACIYRNYCWLGKTQYYLIRFRVVFELLFLIASTVAYSVCYIEEVKPELFYYFLSYFNSILVICSSVYHSKTFKKIMTQFHSFDSYFPNEDRYTRNLNSIKKFTYFVIVMYHAYVISTYSAYYFTMPLDKGELSKCSIFILMITDFALYVCDYRVIVEFPIISTFYLAMSNQLDCIYRSIDMEIKDIEKQKTEKCFADNYYYKYRKEELFDKWSTAYTIVEKNSKLCRIVFGLQIAVLVVIIVAYQIVLLYGMTTLSITGAFIPLAQFTYAFSFVEYMVAFYMSARAAQGVNNSVIVLKQRLCTLLIKSFGCEKQYKATRDFLRLVQTHPIRTSASGSIVVDMTLLPSCVALCTSYTVIILQFNNVL